VSTATSAAALAGRRIGLSPVQRLQRLVIFWLPFIVILVFLLAPFYWMLITAFKPNSELYSDGNPLLVQRPTLEHFEHLLAKTAYLLWTINTFLIATVATGISIFFGVPAGYALAKLRFSGRRAIGLAIFATYLVPGSLMFIPMVQVINQLGLYDTRLALIVVYPTFLLPFCTWLMAGYFRTIPTELEECARIDGTSRFGAMWRITIPLATPGILSCAIFSFTLSWNEFISALTLISDSSKRTIPVGVLVELTRADFYFWGPLMAGALLGSIPVAIVYSFFVDQYAQGLTAGAVKG
jgi:multiple sugar transport system permease protein